MKELLKSIEWLSPETFWVNKPVETPKVMLILTTKNTKASKNNKDEKNFFVFLRVLRGEKCLATK